MLFGIYVLFLILSGVLMLAMAFAKVGQARARVVRGIFGAGFLIYGLYLLLFFQGGHYVLFFYAFVVPVLLTVQFFRERSAVKGRQAMQRAEAWPGQPHQGPEQPYQGPGQAPRGPVSG